MTDRVHPSRDATTLASAGPSDDSAPTAMGFASDALAAIDIGTNSVHMIVARIAANGRFEIITRHKEVVRLGESGEDHIKELTPAAIDRGIAALTRCRSVLDNYDAPVAAVATSAVREADNRRVFLKRARKEAGIEVDVIAGHEEARLIHLGVLQALPVFDVPLLLCDIGGGSTELLIGHRGEVELARSYKLGAIRVTQRFFPDGVTSKKSVERARKFIRATLVGFVREASDKSFDVAVGCSGTIENLLCMSMARTKTDLQSLNGAELTRSELAEVIDLLLDAGTPEGRAMLPGIDAGRADIIVGGALILEQALDLLNIDRLQFSEYALREGALFDLYSRMSGATADHLSDLRQRSVDHLVATCDDDPDHSVKVATLALELFDGLQAVHQLGHDDRELLEAGALLANVGLFIAHSRHHHHSYYVIRNSELLDGFNDGEIEIIAQIARYHRRGEPSLKHPTFAALDADDQERVRWLAAIVRVAIGLDRSHAGSVQSLDVVVSADEVNVVVRPAVDADVSLELFAGRERAAMLERMAARSVVIDVPGAR